MLIAVMAVATVIGLVTLERPEALVQRELDGAEVVGVSEAERRLPAAIGCAASTCG